MKEIMESMNLKKLMSAFNELNELMREEGRRDRMKYENEEKYEKKKEGGTIGFKASINSSLFKAKESATEEE